MNDNFISRRVFDIIDDDHATTLANSQPAATQSGFERLPPFGLTQEAVDSFRAVQAYSTIIEDPICLLSDAELYELRNNVQLRLVSLPLGEDLSAPVQEARFYELCRLVVLLYSCAVTFPIPISRDWDINLVDAIRATLEGMESVPEDLLIWICVLAGMTAAPGGIQRAWFIKLLTRTGCKCSWEEVRVVLRSFLWMDLACDVGGESLWEEVLGGVRK